MTVIQRFGGGLNLNIHFHTLLFDGVFSTEGDGDTLGFRPLPPPTDEEAGVVVARIAARVQRLLKRRGLIRATPIRRSSTRWSKNRRLCRASAAPRFRGESPSVLAPARGCGAGGRSRRVVGALNRHLAGFDLHANVAVPAADRTRLEQLCRYLLRPAVAQDRLRLLADGRVVLTLKTPWADGTRHLVFEPVELLEKLAALTPRPRINLVLYHGVLAPHAGCGRLRCAAGCGAGG